VPRVEIRTLSEVRDLGRCCSAEERQAALRLRFDADRARTLGARGLARAVLSELTGTPADALRFGVGPYGKPHLLEPAELRFNTTHTGDHVGLVVAEGCEVGIDLEVEDPRLDPVEVGPTVFTPSELLALQGVSAEEARTRFFTSWTRKEAALKAWGTGFSLDARAVEVGALFGRCLVHHVDHPNVLVESLELWPSLAGAVAWTPE
jgi:4'-phosphopantetheinyl transferase